MKHNINEFPVGLNVEPLSLLAYQTTPDDSQATLELIDQLHALLRQSLSILTKRQQQVMELYFFQSKTQQETADMLGIDQSTVHNHIFGKNRPNKSSGVQQVNPAGGAVKRLREHLESLPEWRQLMTEIKKSRSSDKKEDLPIHPELFLVKNPKEIVRSKIAQYTANQKDQDFAVRMFCLALWAISNDANQVFIDDAIRVLGRGITDQGVTRARALGYLMFDGRTITLTRENF